MTPYQKANLALNLLILVRDAGGASGITERQLRHALVNDGYATLSIPELQLELRAQADKSWIILHEPELGEKAWRITRLGHSVLQEQGH